MPGVARASSDRCWFGRQERQGPAVGSGQCERRRHRPAEHLVRSETLFRTVLPDDDVMQRWAEDVQREQRVSSRDETACPAFHRKSVDEGDARCVTLQWSLQIITKLIASNWLSGGVGDMRNTVQLPDGEDLNEWMAVNSTFVYPAIPI